MDKGSYVLVLELPEEQLIPAGSLGIIDFRSGYYGYVGSALNGLESRLNRHLRKNKKLRWHIDYLLQKVSISAIITCRVDRKIECDIARALSNRFHSVPGFGSSDCRCRSHLYFSTADMKKEITEELVLLGLNPELEEVPSGEATMIRSTT